MNDTRSCSISKGSVRVTALITLDCRSSHQSYWYDNPFRRFKRLNNNKNCVYLFTLHIPLQSHSGSKFKCCCCLNTSTNKYPYCINPIICCLLNSCTSNRIGNKYDVDVIRKYCQPRLRLQLHDHAAPHRTAPHTSRTQLSTFWIFINLL